MGIATAIGTVLVVGLIGYACERYRWLVAVAVVAVAVLAASAAWQAISS